MNVVKDIISSVKKRFNGLAKRQRQSFPAIMYLAAMNNFLEEKAKCGIYSLKKRNARNVWYGEVSSMHQAYILLVSLPDVLSCNITLRYSADDLFYNATVLDTYDLELTNRCIRKRSCATIALREENKTLFQIKLSIRTDI